jgi:hypothetical protein
MDDCYGADTLACQLQRQETGFAIFVVSCCDQDPWHVMIRVDVMIRLAHRAEDDKCGG